MQTEVGSKTVNAIVSMQPKMEVKAVQHVENQNLLN